jgi:hypothetical protein
MKVFAHVALHELSAHVFPVRLVRGAQIFFNRDGSRRRHEFSISLPPRQP